MTERRAASPKTTDDSALVKSAGLIVESRTWHFMKKVQQSSLSYKDKQIKFNSKKHTKLILTTLHHLEALKRVYPAGSAMRHLIGQVTTRLKRLASKLQNNT